MLQQRQRPGTLNKRTGEGIKYTTYRKASPFQGGFDRRGSQGMEGDRALVKTTEYSKDSPRSICNDVSDCSQ